MNKRLLDILACPRCRESLTTTCGQFRCMTCGATFEQENGIPVLLDDESRHEIARFYQGKYEGGREAKAPPQSLLGRLAAWYPQPPERKIGDVTIRNLQRFWALLRESCDEPNVLMLGKRQSRINGEPTHRYAEIRALEAASFRLDIQARSGVDVVGDGHKMPFVDNAFHGAFALTTLKHLRNPFRFVEELHRVVRPGGLVYAQCVSLAPYHRWPGDHAHFTTSGLAQLFAQFEPIDTGVNGGPSYTIAKLLPYYFACVFSFNNPTLYKLVWHGSAWALAPLRYLDYFLLNNPWKDYVAYSNYFLGRKARS